MDVLVRDAFDVAISNLLVPDLQRFGSARNIEPMHVSCIKAMQSHTYPMLYKIDKNPDWNVFLNMAQANVANKSGDGNAS